MIKVAFDIGRPEDCIDWIITIFTRSWCKHCELVFSDGTSYSADPKAKGTHFIENKDYSDPKKWKLLALPWITPEEEAQIKVACNEELGCGYDWIAVLFGWCWFTFNSLNNWYCTEIVLFLLRHHLWYVIDRWYSPIGLQTSLETEIACRIKH